MYVSLPLLEAALTGLAGKHPLSVLVLPAMLRAGVQVVESADDGTEYGSTDELDLLNEYFTVPGSPLNRPFRAIWERDASKFWRDDRCPGRSLQRLRTDRVKEGTGFFQKKASGGRDLWGLRKEIGSQLGSYVGDPVRIVDLAIWYGRNHNVDNLQSLIEWFAQSFHLPQDDLVGTIYSVDVPVHYSQIPFAAAPLDQNDYSQAVGVVPASQQVEGDIAALVSRMEAKLGAVGFHLSPGLVNRVMSAWIRGDIVVLVGQPGTGKTRFAQLVAEFLRACLRSGWAGSIGGCQDNHTQVT